MTKAPRGSLPLPQGSAPLFPFSLLTSPTNRLGFPTSGQNTLRPSRASRNRSLTKALDNGYRSLLVRRVPPVPYPIERLGLIHGSVPVNAHFAFFSLDAFIFHTTPFLRKLFSLGPDIFVPVHSFLFPPIPFFSRRLLFFFFLSVPFRGHFFLSYCYLRPVFMVFFFATS